MSTLSSARTQAPKQSTGLFLFFELPCSILCSLHQKKEVSKMTLPFLAQKERLDGFSTRRVRFANSLFYVPFCSAKRRTKSSSLLPFLHYTEKRYREKPDTFVGGPEEIRTLDFYNANVALSQLSYRPVNPIIITRDG